MTVPNLSTVRQHAETCARSRVGDAVPVVLSAWSCLAILDLLDWHEATLKAVERWHDHTGDIAAPLEPFAMWEALGTILGEAKSARPT